MEYLFSETSKALSEDVWEGRGGDGMIVSMK